MLNPLIVSRGKQKDVKEVLVKEIPRKIYFYLFFSVLSMDEKFIGKFFLGVLELNIYLGELAFYLNTMYL